MTTHGADKSSYYPIVSNDSIKRSHLRQIFRQIFSVKEVHYMYGIICGGILKLLHVVNLCNVKS